MNPDDLSAREDDEPAVSLSSLDDEGLMAALRNMLSRNEPPPSWSVDLAKSSYDLRAVDAELAVLSSDSGLAGTRAVVRSGAGPRLVVFDAADLSVEIEIEPGARAGSWRLIGQLTPATSARMQVRQQGTESVQVDADDFGRFAIDSLPGGLVSLICIRDGKRPAVTEWIAVG
jgi:hypothetical protein